MSAATLGQQGLAALEARDHDLAVSYLTKAIDASPSPKWLIARSKARVAAKDYPGALADAERAYHLALDRGNRDLIVDAQYRRAVVLIRQGKNADADACLAWVMAACDGGPLAAVEKKVLESVLDDQGGYKVTELDVQEMLQKRKEEEEAARVEAEARGGAAAGLAGIKKSPQNQQRSVAGIMRLTVLRTMKASPPDDPGRKLTVPLVPPKWKEPVEGSAAGASGGAPAKASAPPKKLRIDAYESDEYQTVSVFTKNVDKDKFKLEWLGKSKVRFLFSFFLSSSLKSGLFSALLFSPQLQYDEAVTNTLSTGPSGPHTRGTLGQGPPRARRRRRRRQDVVHRAFDEGGAPHQQNHRLEMEHAQDRLLRRAGRRVNEHHDRRR